MNDYGKLPAHLAARPEAVLTLTLDEIEALVGGPLPWAARLGPGWSGDHPTSRGHHGLAWRAAGWRVERVDAYAGRVTFARDSAE